MNRDRIAGYWRQFRGVVQQRWGRLTANYASVAAGRRKQTLGEIEVASDTRQDASKKQLAEWQAREHKADPIHK